MRYFAIKSNSFLPCHFKIIIQIIYPKKDMSLQVFDQEKIRNFNACASRTSLLHITQQTESRRMNIWLKIFLTCVVSHKVQMKRQVVNTTCLRLAKPSSQQFRLTCSQYNYHCLLDETLTKEFEVYR